MKINIVSIAIGRESTCELLPYMYKTATIGRKRMLASFIKLRSFFDFKKEAIESVKTKYSKTVKREFNGRYNIGCSTVSVLAKELSTQ